MGSTKALLCLIIFSSLLFLGCSSSKPAPPASFNSPANPPLNAPVNSSPNLSVNETNQTAASPVQNPPQNTSGQAPAPAPPASIPAPPSAPVNIETHDRYLLFAPEHPDMLNDSIIIVAFSPSGDADSMINAWLAAAEKRGWPVFASKTFHNGDLPATFDAELISDTSEISSRLGYARPKFVFTGFSGGGQLSLAFAFSHPDTVYAVVTNCGIINQGFMDFIKTYQGYTYNKTAFFIASPADFRYEQMKLDREFLISLGWKTGWIEFEGGHALAPPSTYEQAAEWIEQTIGNNTAT